MLLLLIRVFLFILLPVLTWYTEKTEIGVLGALSALALILLLNLAMDKMSRPLRFGAAALCAGLCFYFPEIHLFLPLFFLEFSLPFFTALHREREEEKAFSLPAFALLLIPLFAPFNPLCFFMSLLALLLAYMGRELELRRADLNRLRDDYEEQFIDMEKNLHLMKQDEERNRHMARLDERNRISRRLHDVTGHTLSSALLQVGALKILNHDASLEEPLNRLHETLDWGMSGIRDAVHDLYADSFDLETELRKTLDRAEGFETALFCPDTSELPLQVKLDLLSIAREAVTNAVKHSDGSRLVIRLSLQSTLLALNVHDNGSCPPGAVIRDEDRGIGLRSIEEIVRRYNGHMNVHRAEGEGFTLHVVFFREQDAERNKGDSK